MRGGAFVGAGEFHGVFGEVVGVGEVVLFGDGEDDQRGGEGAGEFDGFVEGAAGVAAAVIADEDFCDGGEGVGGDEAGFQGVAHDAFDGGAGEVADPFCVFAALAHDNQFGASGFFEDDAGGQSGFDESFAVPVVFGAEVVEGFDDGVAFFFHQRAKL